MERSLYTELINQDKKIHAHSIGKIPPNKMDKDLSAWKFKMTETYVFTPEAISACGLATPGNNNLMAHIIWQFNMMEMWLTVTIMVMFYGRPNNNKDIKLRLQPDIMYWNRISVYWTSNACGVQAEIITLKFKVMVNWLSINQVTILNQKMLISAGKVLLIKMLMVPSV